MPYIRYENHNFRADSLRIIRVADEICREYKRMGFDLTLRQLYYQFVARDILPNNQKSYNRLGNIVNDARLAGLIDWDHIVDRTRNLRSLAHWNSPIDIIESAAHSFRYDKWASQPERIEVWIEKDALVGVLEDACVPLDVPYFSCRGYTSQSEVWGAAQRLRQYIKHGQNVQILHLGDHDPSGVDMTRDIRDRLFLFVATDLFQQEGYSRGDAVATARDSLTVNRIALNMDQIEEFNPPPNPAKFTDARFESYVEQFGRECWELDALPPDVLSQLITDEIMAVRDHVSWEREERKENRDKSVIRKISQRWGETVKFMDYLDKKKEKAS